MAQHFKKYWWIYLIAIIVIIVIVILLIKPANSNGGGTSGGTGGGGTDGGTGGGGTDGGGTPAQVQKIYKCETKKVCKARIGFANWVKTGNQNKCNATSFQQGVCATDCLGTCYTFE